MQYHRTPTPSAIAIRYRNERKDKWAYFRDIDSEHPTQIKCTFRGLTRFANFQKDGNRFISGDKSFKSISAFAGSVYDRKKKIFEYENGVSGWNVCQILHEGQWVSANHLRGKYK